MVESSDEPSLLDRIRSIARHAHASSRSNGADDSRSVHSLDQKGSRKTSVLPIANADIEAAPAKSSKHDPTVETVSVSTRNDADDQTMEALPPPAPPPLESHQGDESASLEGDEEGKKPNIFRRFCQVCKDVLLSSWVNVLLAFVPAGIATEVAGINPIIVFAMNAVAIVPLAGLLSHATESVASEMGDTIGSLMNVTFGNAVELIIFIALTKNEIRIVQASLLGSILANLLMILGMCFLFGGLRFREQIYNSVVTQMSACLLSLSVMSLLLPTAFHASFTDGATADKAVLHVSRGTSVILLLIYILYLLFQLKSHAYMYQSTPQHVIDEESHPGFLHDIMNSSSSSDDSSSSSSSDTDSTSGSVTTAKRIKRVLRGRRRRKSSFSSKDGPSGPSTLRTPSSNIVQSRENIEETAASRIEKYRMGAVASGDEADTDGENYRRSRRRTTTVSYRDADNEKEGSGTKSPRIKERKKSKKKHRKHTSPEKSEEQLSEKPPLNEIDFARKPSEPRVGFLQVNESRPSSSPRRSFNLRSLTVRDVVPVMPPMPSILSSTVFSSNNPTGLPPGQFSTSGVTPRALHRSSSLPSRLNQVQAARPASNPPSTPSPYALPNDATAAEDGKDDHKSKKKMSRTSAIILLLVSTGLVAVCADFLVDSIGYLVNNTSVSEAFIGLIILPIVGNAAEHVAAVTVATKNKMDLAIGIAIGSSIQIAIFVTPVIVLLGWAMQKDMSLYFSLFETISLFVSAFIVNFLVLDGRSNYLEGALLIAAYVIIAVAAFFYPDSDEQSMVGGGDSHTKLMMKRAVVDMIDFASSKMF